jgi:uncharacterized protein YjbJ (UPF0337 family)
MNWDQLEGQWRQLAGSVRERWGRLTNDDFKAIAGKREHLVGRIQERYGYAKERAAKEAHEWSAALKETARRASPFGHK